ncbi:hypothetical protein CGLO_17426 [Colletotrichum gloeosporioides Cg-14]|uniref:LysM domain-containing protein n=1 Tax=Colletotrichum gloeosporioides (strain Cg-14) TaxID=1237896 RepID=T0JL19_COLGC|nr:hypothetical protein CGLO_17426 [Colletotrichum gloeosporioides Cg-14]
MLVRYHGSLIRRGEPRSLKLANCGGLWTNGNICVSIIGGTQTSVLPTTTTKSAGNNFATPQPTQHGVVNDCDRFYFVQSRDSCAPIASNHGISVTQLAAWNNVGGTACGGLWANVYVCVRVIGATPTTAGPAPPTTTAPDNGVSTPAPTQAGMVGNCDRFYFVGSGDTPPTDTPQSREEPPVPIVTGTKPVYASACPDATAYWSACQCFTGIKATTITIVAGAETTTSIIPSSQIISTPLVTTTATPTSNSPSPSCTIGAEFALHIIEEESDLCQNMLLDPYFEPENYDIEGLLQGRRPWGVGIKRYIDYYQPDENLPISYGGVYGPPRSSLRCNTLVHRGYIKATLPGAYEFLINQPPPGDVLFAWFGDKAKSGSFSVSNADIIVPNNNGWPYRYFVYFRDASEYIPFRLFWSHGRGRSEVLVGVFPAYTIGLDKDVQPQNPIFYSNCSGSNSPAPAWPSWESEDYSGGN